MLKEQLKISTKTFKLSLKVKKATKKYQQKLLMLFQNVKRAT